MVWMKHLYFTLFLFSLLVIFVMGNLPGQESEPSSALDRRLNALSEVSERVPPPSDSTPKGTPLDFLKPREVTVWPVSDPTPEEPGVGQGSGDGLPSNFTSLPAPQTQSNEDLPPSYSDDDEIED